MHDKWKELISKNFDNASLNYNKNAEIQKYFAQKIATLCAKNSIHHGIWADLGSGTGLLADSLEALHPNQSVLRIDSSEAMIANQSNSFTKKWDLNLGLPPLSEPPTLLASNFVLHWLDNPNKILQEWFQALAPGGWIALALPVKGSFPEWYQACEKASLKCTALDLPSEKLMIKAFDQKYIRYNKLESWTQSSSKITTLLKSMVNVGAQASPQPSLTIREWRKIQNCWERFHNNQINLTWNIQLLLLQR